MKKLQEENLKEIIDKQFEINGYDVKYKDVKSSNWSQKGIEWYEAYTTTPEKEKEFREWLKGYLKPYTFPGRLEKEIGWVILTRGLKTIRKESK